MNRALQNREFLKKSVSVSGLLGMLYGVFILRVTKLGFKMQQHRSLISKAFVFLVPAILPTLCNEYLIDKGGRRDFTENIHFDPIDSYLRQFSV